MFVNVTQDYMFTFSPLPSNRLVPIAPRYHHEFYTLANGHISRITARDLREFALVSSSQRMARCTSSARPKLAFLYD